MGQVRHGSATITHAIRAAIQRSTARQGVAKQCPERDRASEFAVARLVETADRRIA